MGLLIVNNDMFIVILEDLEIFVLVEALISVLRFNYC